MRSLNVTHEATEKLWLTFDDDPQEFNFNLVPENYGVTWVMLGR